MGCGISSESKTEVTSLWSDRQSSRVTVIQILRHDTREIFGMEVIDQWGFFMDMNMSRIINGFFAFYPRGHRVLQGHTSDVWSSVVSNDGSHLFTGSEDTTIIKWDMLSLEQISRFQAHSGPVHCLAYSPRMLISGGGDKMIRVWDDSTLAMIHEFESHEKDVYCLSLNHDCDLLLSASSDQTVKIWSMDTWEIVLVFTEHTSTVSSAYFIRDSVISTDYDGCIRVWIPQTGEEKKTSHLRVHSLFDLSINCDATILAVVHQGLTLLHWPDLRPFRTIKFGSSDESAICVAFHPSDPNIVAYDRGFAQPRIDLYHTQSRKSIGMEGSKCGSATHSRASEIHFNNEGSRVITVSFDHTTRVWDVADQLESLQN